MSRETSTRSSTSSAVPDRAAAELELERELAERETELEHELAPPAEAPPGGPPGIDLGSRSLFVGNTGTGKSEGCAALFARHTGQRILIDVQDWYGFGPAAGPALEVDRVSDIDWRYRTIRYVPRFGSATEYDELFAAIFQRGNVFVWADELEDVAPSSEVRRWVRKTWKQGRKFNVTMAGATQRPVGVDRAAINQAEHAFVFPMVDSGDLRTLAPRLGMGTDELAGVLAGLPEHGYLRHTLGVPHVFAMPPLPPDEIAHTRGVVLPYNEGRSTDENDSQDTDDV